MRVKEYVKKYNLDNSNFFNRNLFIEDMTNDLSELFKVRTINNKISVGNYELCVKEINEKWNNIFNKSGLNTEQITKFWNYFYATVIAKYKEVFFGDKEGFKTAKHEYLMKSDTEYAHKYSRWKMYQEMEGIWEGEFRREREQQTSFMDNIIERMLRMLSFNKMMECKRTLQIEENILLNPDEINIAYKKLVKIHHPDAGGDAEKFREVTEARDYLLNLIFKES